MVTLDDVQSQLLQKPSYDIPELREDPKTR